MKRFILGLAVLAAVLMGVFVYYSRPSATAPSPVISPTHSPSNPVLLSPNPGDTITGPLVIKGYVPKNWTFEGQFQMSLVDDKRQEIIHGRVPVEWDSDNQKDTLYFVEVYNFHTTAKSGYLVLENDNPSGLPENQKSIEIPVKFSASPPGVVYLFYPNKTEDMKISPLVACQVVLPVARHLGISQTPVKDTLELLLKGEITSSERKAGFSSEFPHPSFSVKSLNLKDGVLTIEFNDPDGFSGGGSCRTGWLAAQITYTMEQFPEVQTVRYQPDSIFQP